MVPARFKVWQHRFDMVFKEHHRHKDDIARRDVFLAALQFTRVAPVRSGMQRERQPRHFFLKLSFRCRRNARKMIIKRDDHDADRAF